MNLTYFDGKLVFLIIFMLPKFDIWECETRLFDRRLLLIPVNIYLYSENNNF